VGTFRQHRHLGAALAAWLSLAGGFARADLTNGLLFHAGFDAGLPADAAVGNPVPQVIGEARYAAGIRGKALLVGNACVTRLAYANEGNFNIASGTATLWIKPLDWLGKRGAMKCINLFCQGEGSPHGYFGLEMERFGQPAAQMIFYSIGFTNRQPMHITCPASMRWTNGEWHQAALTWDHELTRLYVDGVFLGSAQLTAPFTPADYHSKVFVLGNDGDEHTAIDEMRIWSRPLSAAEILALYQANQ
jgi:hypothetical protein